MIAFDSSFIKCLKYYVCDGCGHGSLNGNLVDQQNKSYEELRDLIKHQNESIRFILKIVD